MRRYARIFTLSTIAAFALPLGIVRAIDVFGGIAVGIGTAFIWFAGLMMAVNKYGPRADWLALTAPLGLYWLLFLAYWLYRAGRGDPTG
jgi:type VI protein secretion system component VasK